MLPSAADRSMMQARFLWWLLVGAAWALLAYLLLAFGAAACFAWGMGRNVSEGLGDIEPEDAVKLFHLHRSECDRLRDLLVPHTTYSYLLEIPATGRVEADQLLRK